MDRSKLERFVSKYNLGGACESVTFDSAPESLLVRAISSDKNVLSEVMMTFEVPDEFLPVGRYSIYETTKLRSMISILNDSFEATPKVNGGAPYAITFVDDLKTEATFVLSDESIIPDVPDLKVLPEFELKVNLDDDFVNTFIKAKSALVEAETFTIDSEDGVTDVVLGYSTSNTNRIKLRVNSNDAGSVEPISFSADYMKNILLANKDVKGGVMEVSSSGLSRLTFESNDIKSVYYLVQIMVSA